MKSTITDICDSLLNGQLSQAKQQAKENQVTIGEVVDYFELEKIPPEQMYIAIRRLFGSLKLEEDKPSQAAYIPRRLDIAGYNPDPQYIRWVIRQKRISLDEAARRIGMPRSTLRDKLNPKLSTRVSYAEQYAIENA